MLQSMRSASRTWVMRGFFAILVVAFVILWGVGDVWQPGSGGTYTVASVGKETITTYDFLKAYQRRKQQYTSAGQTVNDAVLKDEVLELLVFESLLNQESKRLGLAISDKQLREFIRNSPNFKDRTGTFNIDLFNAVARSQGMTEAEFTEEIREQLVRNQLIQTMTNGLTVPQSYIETLFKFQNEKRVVEWAVVTPDKVKDISPPTEEEIAEFYEENKPLYTIPESRDFTVLVMTEDELKKQIQLTDEERQQGFERYRAEFKSPIPTKEETERVIDLIKSEKVSDRYNQLITQIDDDLAAGIKLEEIADTYKLSLVTAEGLQRDGDAKSKPALTTTALIEVVENGFILEVGDDPTLTQLENGEVIAIRVDNIYPERIQTLDQVKDNVSAAVLNQKKEKAARAHAEDILKAVDSGISLKDIAQKQKLSFNSNITLERSGTANDQVALSIRAMAFRTDIGKAAIAPVSEGYAVVSPLKTIEASIENRQDELKVFADNIERAVSSDMLEEYWFGLRRNYSYEGPNRNVLERLE